MSILSERKEFTLLQMRNVKVPCLFMRDAPKVILPILLRWSTTSEVEGGDMAVEIEPSHKYSITFCCHETGGSLTKWHLK